MFDGFALEMVELPEAKRPWAIDLRGHGLDCGHHMAQEAPQLLARELAAFLQA